MASARTKTTVTLRATAACPSHSKSEVRVRDLEFNVDEPTERGGTNTGPAPTDTALAALIGCTNVIGHKCAAKLGVVIGHLDIAASCQFDRRGVTLAEEIDTPFQAVALEVKCNGSATQAELDQVAAEVAKYCPLSKLFERAGARVEVEWRQA